MSSTKKTHTFESFAQKYTGNSQSQFLQVPNVSSFNLGENMPDTMSATGTPTIADDAEVESNGYSEVALGFDDEHKILPWFENMVSARDFD